MRITVSWEEAQQLKLLLKTIIEPTEAENEFIDLFCHKLDLEIAKVPSDKKRNATAKATDGRVKDAKLKIFNALNLMRLEGKKININSVARDAGVSYNTAKKYRAVIEAGQKSHFWPASITVK